MTTPKYKIGEIVKNTDAFGTVKVVDIFRSITNNDWYIYRVETDDDFKSSILTTEEELDSQLNGEDEI